MVGRVSDRGPNAHAGVVLAPGEGVVGSGPRRFGSRLYKAGVAETGGAYLAFEEILLPGGVAWAHIHHIGEEAFFVLEGEFTILLGDRAIPAPVGTFILVPRGTTHGFRNDSDRPARMLITVSPVEFAAVWDEGRKLTAALGQFDSPEHRAMRARHRGFIETVEQPGWTQP